MLRAVTALGGNLDLPVVLHRIVTTAMEMVDARYGAMGVLDDTGRELAEFITAGLDERELAALAGTHRPRGRGVLGMLIEHPRPLRVPDIAEHPASVGFPPGHPPMRTLLGIALSARGGRYGNLYLADRRDGRPFDERDEEVLVALAGAAGVAIENARLFERVRAGAEQFQRLLLPELPDPRPFTVAGAYRPAAVPGRLGGDWYDALSLPDGALVAVIGDVIGHDLRAAATMSRTRNMLRALLCDRRESPAEVLRRLDRMGAAMTDNPMTTACLVRVAPESAGNPKSPRNPRSPGEGSWGVTWSTAGHPPPLLLDPAGGVRYLRGEPGLPLGVDPDRERPGHHRSLSPGAVLVLFTDGLVEHPRHSLDEGLTELARLADRRRGLSPRRLCEELMEHHPGDGHDDMAVLALRLPPVPAPAAGEAPGTTAPGDPVVR
ncbi:SpoIIE family protein phosphatase [Streptomyces sp. ST2-7A]|nr:GAF domain-containing SpoIIE family protein phosphatase [Streptomyces sp. ST2-7A]MCE7079663.1 SpoIIE family protein phosphatase [Streptomyces sp. ST2-7A]